MIAKLIAEATNCDFNVALEIKKPISWLQSISAFANCRGGAIFFGVDDKGTIAGLDSIQTDAKTIRRLIKECITPLPEFVLMTKEKKGKVYLTLTVSMGNQPPYYYKADGKIEAYMRIDKRSFIAPDYVINALILKGANKSFDSIITDTPKSDYSFTLLEATYKERTKVHFDPYAYASFGLANDDGLLTNAGKLFADNHSGCNARLFCTRWNGMVKGSIFDDSLDDKEYEGSLIHLLQSGFNFIKNNSKVRFEKKRQYSIDKPDYSEGAVTEALVNAIVHRDYLIMGSEIHIDMFNDRLEITSPGGMYAGKTIQEYNIDESNSLRRNPIIANLFQRMKFMERRDSGLKKILAETMKMSGYNDGCKPIFNSTTSSFTVILKSVRGNTIQDITHDTTHDEKIDLLLDFCTTPKSRDQIHEHMGISNLYYFNKNYLKPLLDSKQLILTIPDKPTSRNQKYVTKV